eukprot:TRINITY_DN14299_c0_g1_i1.p1 TRINITY_DN14299_c0_g1~~TRINITY_DN14299_c0_g1_i1.p1  ORF type:complete len:1156 (-),score=254.86 TRINITY_DN14299_c0_g1_i1:284-3751(-)
MQYLREQEPGLRDLVLLGKLTEREIAENLKQRLRSEIIYTYISNVLISVNPFKRLPMYTDKHISQYRSRNRNELPPHVFALTEDTYKSMVQEEENQCIIISGESGAGKTEASKQVMQYLAAVSGNTPEMQRVKTIMLDSNPVLEAFGNAKTVRNDNSSRFGKFFEIYFDRVGGPTGGNISNFLLEKSRVVYQQRGERCYHIFYQLCCGLHGERRNKLHLRPPEGFRYLNQGNCLTRDGVSDEKEFNETFTAMANIGVPEEEIHAIQELLAGILNMGEIEFTCKDDVCSVKNPDQLQVVKEILGLDPEILKKVLCYKKVKVGGEVIESPLIMDQCRAARDAIAKTIYEKIFDWVVKKINEAFAVTPDMKKLMIGILDIYGFEVFDRNGFEQFCINYVNEKLQQIFIELTLKVEQEEYVREKITWQEIKYFNNKIVCDLCEAKNPSGIFPVLDDVCATMAKEIGATVDMKALDKLEQFCGANPHFKRFTQGFTIRHYAGDVSYTVGGFVEKNKDALSDDLMSAVRSSHNKFLKEWFPPDDEEPDPYGRSSSPKKGSGRQTAGTKIKNQAALLVKTLMNCTPHYIRCIKPNDVREGLGFVDERVVHQVKYLGLLENVKVRRAGFAYRQYFDRFVKRFKYICPLTFPRPFKGTDKQAAQAIIDSIPQLRGGQYYQMGETKIFIRYPENLFLMEELREKSFGGMAASIQRAFRKFKARKQFITLRKEINAVFINGGKERRRGSIYQTFEGDYLNYPGFQELKDIIEYEDPAQTTWNEYYAEAYGRKYFYNPYTQQTVWDKCPTFELEKVKFTCMVERIQNHCTGQAGAEYFIITDKHIWLIEKYYPPPPPPPPPPKPKPKAKRGKKGKAAPEPPPPEPPPQPTGPLPPVFLVRRKAALNLLRSISVSLLADEYVVLHFYDPGPQTELQKYEQDPKKYVPPGGIPQPVEEPAPAAKGKKGKKKKAAPKAAPVIPPPVLAPNDPTDMLDDCILKTHNRTELVAALRQTYKAMMSSEPELVFNNSVGYYSRSNNPKGPLVAKGLTFEMDWTLTESILYCCGVDALLIRAPQGLTKETVEQLEKNKEARRKAARERYLKERAAEEEKEKQKDEEREQERKRQIAARKAERAAAAEREEQELAEKKAAEQARKERAARVVAANRH